VHSRRTKNIRQVMLLCGAALSLVAMGCATSPHDADTRFVEKQELLFESKGNVTTVVRTETVQIAPSDAHSGALQHVREEESVPVPVGDQGNALRENGDALLPNDIPSQPNATGDSEVSLDASQMGDEDSPLETGEIDKEKAELDIDSSRSPEELGGLVKESASGSIEDGFALCEGSVYMEEWSRNFDARWLEENGKRFKRRTALNRALGEARSQEFLKLLFPALGALDFDYPVVITDDVIKWMQYFQTRGRKSFVTWLRRAEDIVPQMLPVLESHGLPKDLIYLAMIESGFNNRALSIARAAGPWQFMRPTGRMYKLTINDFVDERRDPAKATVAAAQYLTNLYAMFGDWHLAAASYNAGEGRVKRALRGLESQDFFSASEARRLPNETRNYVPKLIAAMIISKNPEKFGFDVAAGSRALKWKTVRLEKSVSLAELAQSINVDRSVLENLNPELRVGITPPAALTKRNGYQLRVPEASYEAAVAAIDTLPEASRITRVAARVRSSETLANFARRNGLRLASLQAANPGLKASTRLRNGQSVMVPVTLGSGAYEKFADGGKKSNKKFAKKANKNRLKYVNTKKKGTRKSLATRKR
jgi:membrane-bound lytic murein transglycosylase D